jgi:hypothetical protein
VSYVQAIDELIESGEWDAAVSHVPWRDAPTGTRLTPMTECWRHPNRFPANEWCPRCETEDEAAWMAEQDRLARAGDRS